MQIIEQNETLHVKAHSREAYDLSDGPDDFIRRKKKVRRNLMGLFELCQILMVMHFLQKKFFCVMLKSSRVKILISTAWTITWLASGAFFRKLNRSMYDSTRRYLEKKQLVTIKKQKSSSLISQFYVFVKIINSGTSNVAKRRIPILKRKHFSRGKFSRAFFVRPFVWSYHMTLECTMILFTVLKQYLVQHCQRNSKTDKLQMMV